MELADVRAACWFAQTYSRQFPTTIVRVDTNNALLNEDGLECVCVSPPGLVVTRESSTSLLLFSTNASWCAGALVLRVTYFGELVELLEIPACFMTDGCADTFDITSGEPVILQDAVLSVAVGQDGSWFAMVVADGSVWVMNNPLAASRPHAAGTTCIVEREFVLDGEKPVQVVATLADTLLVATDVALYEFTSRGTYVRKMATESYVHMVLHGTMLVALQRERGGESVVDVLDVVTNDLLHSFTVQSLSNSDMDENPGAEAAAVPPSSTTTIWRIVGVCVFADGPRIGVLQYEYVPTPYGEQCLYGCVLVRTLTGTPLRQFYMDGEHLQDLPSKLACTPANELIVLTTHCGCEDATLNVFSEYGDLLANCSLEDNLLGFEDFPALFGALGRVYYVHTCSKVTIHAVPKLA